MKKKIVSRFFFRWRHISSPKFDQDFLIFFDEEYKLKSESSSLTKLWAIEEEPKRNPSLAVEPIPKPGRPKRNFGKEMWLVSSGTVTWGWGGGEVHSDKLESHSSSWEPSEGESESVYVVSIEIEQMGKAGIGVGGRVSVERPWTRGQMHSAWTPHLRIWDTRENVHNRCIQIFKIVS